MRGVDRDAVGNDQAFDYLQGLFAKSAPVENSPPSESDARALSYGLRFGQDDDNELADRSDADAPRDGGGAGSPTAAPVLERAPGARSGAARAPGPHDGPGTARPHDGCALTLREVCDWDRCAPAARCARADGHSTPSQRPVTVHSAGRYDVCATASGLPPGSLFPLVFDRLLGANGCARRPASARAREPPARARPRTSARTRQSASALLAVRKYI